MFFMPHLSIQQKLTLAIIVVGSAFAVLVGVTGYWGARQAIIDQSFDAVEAVATTRNAQIEQWVGSLRVNIEAYSGNASVVTAMQAFRNALDTSQDVDINREQRLELFRETFVSAPDLVDAKDLSSPYRAIHSRFQPFFRETQLVFGYSDILLVSPLGDVIFSSNKNDDIFTNFFDGKYSNSTLGDAVRVALENPESSDFSFVDFSHYPPAREPTAFAINTVYDGDTFIGVLVFAVPIDSIEGILNINVGVGETGQTYIVGRDHLLRTELPVSGVNNSTVLNSDVVVESEAIKSALAGLSNVGFTENYLGTEVLSAWRPVFLDESNVDAEWVLIVETSVAEATAPANRIFSAIAIGLVVGAIIVVLLSIMIGQQIGAPIAQLTHAVKRAAGGDFSERVVVKSQDEIGTLANVFNTMSEQLQDMFENLEQKVRTRTRDLELAMKVSAEATTELRLESLLSEVVNQTLEAFDLYHVSVFLVDEKEETATFVIGTGEAGRAMLADEWAFSVHDREGIVPRVMRTRNLVLVNDISESSTHKQNQHLPETQAELTLPMTVHDRIVGVLDLQSREVNRFGDDDQRVLQLLAHQLAVAVEHAHLYEEQVGG